MVQNHWYHFGAPPILVYFSGDWDVHWGYGVLAQCPFAEMNMCQVQSSRTREPPYLPFDYQNEFCCKRFALRLSE